MAARLSHNNAVAERLALTNATVGKWRARFVQHRINGLYDELRPGRPRTIDEERMAGLVRKTLQKKPRDGSTHWSVRQAAAETGISKSSVQRYLQLFGLKPHRTESFKLSTDLKIAPGRAGQRLRSNPCTADMRFGIHAYAFGIPPDL
jgi:putative transposase